MTSSSEVSELEPVARAVRCQNWLLVWGCGEVGGWLSAWHGERGGWVGFQVGLVGIGVVVVGGVGVWSDIGEGEVDE